MLKKLNIKTPQPSLLRDVNSLHDKAVSVIDKFDAEREQALRYDTATRRKYEIEDLQRIALAELAVTARDLQRYADLIPIMRRETQTLQAPEPTVIHVELRGFFLSLTAAERKKRIDAALVENDQPTINALLFAPPYLSGVTAKQQTDLREQVIQAAHGEKLQDLADLESATERSQAVIKTARDHVQQIDLEGAAA